MLQAVCCRALVGFAFQNIVDEERADLVAAQTLEIKKLDAFLLRFQWRQIEREALADHAIGLKQNDVELVSGIIDVSRIVDDDVSAATFFRRLKFVEFERGASGSIGGLRLQNSGGCTQSRKHCGGGELNFHATTFYFLSLNSNGFGACQ